MLSREAEFCGYGDTIYDTVRRQAADRIRGQAKPTLAMKGKSVSSHNLGTQGRAFLRVAGRKSGENRWIRAFYRGGSVALGSVGHVLHVLWLEVAGLLFLTIALVGGGAAVREYHRYAHGGAGIGRLLLAAAFALAFLYFGVTSFTRSRRKSHR
jgi:hypothetical protein